MGRGIAAGPVPPEIVRHHFALRQDGQIVRRECRIASLAHEPATFSGPNGVAMVRMRYEGRVRRISAARVAYAITKGHWPSGLLAKPHHKPSASGGRASSLALRAKADMALINAMSEAPHASIATLSALTGVRESRVSSRLTKLAKHDLTQSPQCVPGRSWMLTQAGKALAMNGQPLLDDLDRELLVAVARTPSRLTALKRQIGVCALTIRRRVDRLAERGLIEAQDGGFRITDQGRAALGPDAPVQWLDPARILASLARDVTARRSPDAMTHAEAGRAGAAVRWRKDERMAG
jgi:Mn-dependent DtxR family transcriptional regulator